MAEIIEEHEARVLGAALEARGLWLAQINRIIPELFGKNRKLATALCTMTEQGKPLDVLSVRSWLEEHNIKIGLADLASIGDHAPAGIAAMKASVDALHEAHKRRQLADLAAQITRLLADRGVSAAEIQKAVLLSAADIGSEMHGGFERIAESVTKVMANVSKTKTGAIKTGVRRFDEKIGGLRPGQLALLGARPSMGKTALALNIAREVAAGGGSVALFSLEMNAAQLVERMLSDISGANLAKIVNHQLNQVELTRVTNAAAQAHRFNIWISERADQFEAASRQLQYQHGLDLIVVDYLQLMETKAQSREQEISQLSRRLKRLATSLRVPVLALSQLNRNIEARTSKRPQLSDLRESGSLEQDADIVMLLWREGYYSEEADPTEAELIIAKNRNGPTGFVRLIWQAECARFENPKST